MSGASEMPRAWFNSVMHERKDRPHAASERKDRSPNPRELRYNFRMKFRSLSEAKLELGMLIRLAERGETVVISRHGKPAVRLAPISEDDLQLTAAESVKLNSWLRNERAAGRTRKHSSMEELLQRTRPPKKSRA
jgi:prevent-host-death family protein